MNKFSQNVLSVALLALAFFPYLLCVIILWGPAPIQVEALSVVGFIINALRSEVLHVIVLIVAQLIVLTLLLRTLHQWADAKADKWMAGLVDMSPNKQGETTIDFDGVKNINNTEKSRLTNQYKTMKTRACHHATVMKFFYTRHYTAIVMVSVCGVIAAVMTVYIGAEGFNQLDSWAQAIFLTMTAATIYFTAIPKVYKQADNIAKNKNAYLSYLNLENELLSYGSTTEDRNGERISPTSFIHYIDQEIESRNNLYLGFDMSQIPDFKAQLGQYSRLSPVSADATHRKSAIKQSHNEKSPEKVSSSDVTDGQIIDNANVDNTKKTPRKARSEKSDKEASTV